MAFLAYLGELEQDVLAYAEALAYGIARQIDALGGDVFGEVAGMHVGAEGAHEVDVLYAEQAQLAVGAVGMGVAVHAPVGLEHDLGPARLAGAFLLTDIHCHNAHVALLALIYNVGSALPGPAPRSSAPGQGRGPDGVSPAQGRG